MANSALQQGLSAGFGAVGQGIQNGWNITGNIYGGVGEFLRNPFDITGEKAAARQYQNQLALDNSAREFSALEAQRQREWEKMMSDTAFQRQVKDLEAAGLNPWLAVQNAGSGASTPSGSSASSSSGNASQANNKIYLAAGLIATALRMFLTKGK